MSIKEIFKNPQYGLAPENKENVLDWVKQRQPFGLFIDGRWQKPLSGEYLESINPVTEKAVASVAVALQKDVDAAVNAANKALPKWASLSGYERAKYLYALARQIQKHAKLFAVLESLDNGKPFRESRDIDIPLVARHFYHHAGWAKLMDTELSDYKEIGVVGQIIPWNFPMLMLSWKVAPALAMGNTVVLKPAETTSLTALLFAEICEKAGLPKGVLNIITGDGKTGALLVDHPLIKKIAFTGSTNVGKYIRRETAGTQKRISLELGGKSPFIVFEDADLDSVVEGVVDAIWFNQGQVCCAGSRLLVQESVAEKLYEKLKVRATKLRLGDGLDKNTDVGAINSAKQLKTIERLVATGVKEGCDLWQANGEDKNGLFYPPSIFINVAPSATVAQEEIFGPVLVTSTFRTHKEAVKLANNTRYGLAASIWTENINLALEIAPAVKAGSVWINCTNQFDAASGFGGYRESGFGREGGKEGLYEYVTPKVNDEFQDKPFSMANPTAVNAKPVTSIDRTHKLYIAGKHTRNDSGYSRMIYDALGNAIEEVGEGNRKDIRNAVEAASKQTAWAQKTGHQRAQILYYLAENLEIRKEEFVNRIAQTSCVSKELALKEVEASLQRIFTYAAFADKYDGAVHETTANMRTIAMPEPLGIMGVVCPDEMPLLGFVSSVFPAIAMGNSVVVVPSEKAPLSVLDFVQILATSDVPAGLINIVTGKKEELTATLSAHDNVDGLWYFGDESGSEKVEKASADNLKRTWVNYGRYRNWLDPKHGEGEDFLRHATQVKNIWIPYGA